MKKGKYASLTRAQLSERVLAWLRNNGIFFDYRAAERFHIDYIDSYKLLQRYLLTHRYTVATRQYRDARGVMRYDCAVTRGTSRGAVIKQPDCGKALALATLRCFDRERRQ